jgi:hypothetical protein
MSVLWPKKEYHISEWKDYSYKYPTVFEFERKLFGNYKRVVHQALWGCSFSLFLPLPLYCACYEKVGDWYVRVGWHWKGRCFKR